MDKSFLNNDETWSLIKWIGAMMGALIALLTRLLFKNIIERLDDYFLSVKKNETRIEEIADHLQAEISSINQLVTGLDMKFHAFKRQQEGVLNEALDDLKDSRKQSQEDREAFLKILEKITMKTV